MCHEDTSVMLNLTESSLMCQIIKLSNYYDYYYYYYYYYYSPLEGVLEGRK